MTGAVLIVRSWTVNVIHHGPRARIIHNTRRRTMKNPLTNERVSTGCVGCDFVKEFTPNEGGWCRVHGDIKSTPKREMGTDTVIERLGGNKLSLLED